MIYVDSNVFIFPILGEDEHSIICKNVLAKIAANELPAFTSALTWDEIVWAVRKHLGIKDSIEEGRKFLEFPYLKILPVDELTLKLANDLAETHNLKPRDAIHAATSISHGARQILSDDPDFDSLSEIKRVSIEKFRTG